MVVGFIKVLRVSRIRLFGFFTITFLLFPKDIGCFQYRHARAVHQLPRVRPRREAANYHYTKHGFLNDSLQSNPLRATPTSQASEQKDPSSPAIPQQQQPPSKREVLRQQLLEDFLAHASASIEMDTLTEFTIRGPKSKKNSKHSKQPQQTAERLRGQIRLVTARKIQLSPTSHNRKKRSKKAAASKPSSSGLFWQVTFKYHGATDIAKNWPVEEATARLQAIFLPAPTEQQQQGYDDAPFTKHKLTRSVLEASEWDVVDDETSNNKNSNKKENSWIQSASLETTTTRWELFLGQNAKPRLTTTTIDRSLVNPETAQSSSSIAATITAPGTAAPHDRRKQVPVERSAAFWQALGVTDKNGKPKIGMASKYRQCQKFVEIVGNLVASTVSVSFGEDPSIPDAADGSNTAKTSVATNHHQTVELPTVIQVTDMGCGRAYLTFCLHSYLLKTYGRTAETQQEKEMMVKSHGIDVRPKLVQEISGIARALGDGFESLTFNTGTIQEYVNDATAKVSRSSPNNESAATRSRSSNTLSILIALHACDTATDDALWSGIASDATIIVVAPCCHKEARAQLNRHAAQAGEKHPLADILRHNIYRERLAETATDSMRALLLEIANYRVQVFEFVGGEHTSKNVMITAVKRTVGRSKTEMEDLRKRLCDLAALHGISHMQLCDWMGEELRDRSGQRLHNADKKVRNVKMPPLPRKVER